MIIISYFILQMGLAPSHYNEALLFSSAILFHHRLKVMPTWHSTCRRKPGNHFSLCQKRENNPSEKKTLCIIFTSYDIMQN